MRITADMVVEEGASVGRKGVEFLFFDLRQELLQITIRMGNKFIHMARFERT